MGHFELRPASCAIPAEYPHHEVVLRRFLEDFRLEAEEILEDPRGYLIARLRGAPDNPHGPQMHVRQGVIVRFLIVEVNTDG